MPDNTIRDLIYFDEEKATSFVSQLQGWLTTAVVTTSEHETGRHGDVSIDFKLLGLQAGKSSANKLSTAEQSVFHHGLLTHLEDILEERSVVSSVDESSLADLDADEVRSAIIERGFVRATGLPILQDYSEVSLMIDNFNELSGFFTKASQQSVEQSAPYIEISAQLQELRKAVSTQGLTRDKKALAKTKIAEIEELRKNLLSTATSLESLQNWFIDGFRRFMTVFMRDRIALRLQPSSLAAGFEILANLKRTSFTDADVSNVLFAYGTRPTTKWTVLGYITSAPPEEEAKSNPSPRAARRAMTGDFTSAFDQMFAALENFEQFTSLARYPNVSLYPIAVYRSLNVGNGA